MARKAADTVKSKLAIVNRRPRGMNIGSIYVSRYGGRWCGLEPVEPVEALAAQLRPPSLATSERILECDGMQ